MAAAVVGDIVMGELDPVRSDRHPATARYFVINTKTDEAWLELGRMEYLDRLRAVGVAAPPRLVRLDRFVTLRALRTSD